MPEGDGGSRIDAAGVDAAIARVLQAERDAREDVQRCAVLAERLVEQAHERARQIARRSAHRSVRVQRWSAAALQSRLDELAAGQARHEQSSARADDPGRLQRAVEALAVQLTVGAAERPEDELPRAGADRPAGAAAEGGRTPGDGGAP